MMDVCLMELTTGDRTADFGARITKARDHLLGFGIKANRIKNADLREKRHGIGESSTINLVKMEPVLLENGGIVAMSPPTNGRASLSKLSIIRTFEAFVLAC